MRPVSFFIEIPDRPVYQPGSGPTLAPITLQPDNSDTGWVIADTVEFQGLVQYVITPTNNPAHRKPVKKQHILDWVSAKAYEDFEYNQYRRQIDEEKEKEARILAKSAAFRERVFGRGYARDGRRTRKPFAKYMQLEPVEDSDTGITSGHLSSPEHSTDELNEDFRPGLIQTAKRKRSIGVIQDSTPSVKRRGLSGINTQSLMWKPWHPSVVNHSRPAQATSTEDEDDTEVGAENTPNTPGTEKAVTLPRAHGGQGTAVYPFSAPSKYVPASASPLRLSPRMQLGTIGPPLHVEANATRSASPLDLSIRQASTKSRLIEAPRYRRESQPPQTPKLSRLDNSAAQFERFGRAQNGTGESSKYSRSKQEVPIKPSGNENITIHHWPRRRSRSKSAKLDHSYDKTLPQKGDISYEATGRGRHELSDEEGPSPKTDKRSASSSSGSSNILQQSLRQMNSKPISEQSKYFARAIVPQGADDAGDEMEVDSQQSWEIDGILDDELRLIDGNLVRHYLCEWIGDYEPTWEPRENISTVALQKYEKKKKKRRKKTSDIGFDGAADIILDKGESFSSKLVQRLDDEVQILDETSDSGEFMDALSDTANFITPSEHPRSQSRADSIAEDTTGTRIALY